MDVNKSIFFQDAEYFTLDPIQDFPFPFSVSNIQLKNEIGASL